MKLTRDQALDLLWDGECTELPGFAKVAESQTGSGRWCSYHQLVIRDDCGNLWAADFERGLTEYQDIDAFQDEEDVEFEAVEKVPVTIYEYRRKNA